MLPIPTMPSRTCFMARRIKGEVRSDKCEGLPICDLRLKKGGIQVGRELNRQSAIGNRQSAIGNRQSAILLTPTIPRTIPRREPIEPYCPRATKPPQVHGKIEFPTRDDTPRHPTKGGDPQV